MEQTALWTKVIGRQTRNKSVKDFRLSNFWISNQCFLCGQKRPKQHSQKAELNNKERETTRKKKHWGNDRRNTGTSRKGTKDVVVTKFLRGSSEPTILSVIENIALYAFHHIMPGIPQIWVWWVVLPMSFSAILIITERTERQLRRMLQKQYSKKVRTGPTAQKAIH